MIYVLIFICYGKFSVVAEFNSHEACYNAVETLKRYESSGSAWCIPKGEKQ